MNEGTRAFLLESIATQLDFIIAKWHEVAEEKGEDQADIEFSLNMETFQNRFDIGAEMDGTFSLDTAVDAMAVTLCRVALSFDRQGILAVKGSDGLWHVGSPEDLALDPVLHPRDDIDENDE